MATSQGRVPGVSSVRKVMSGDFELKGVAPGLALQDRRFLLHWCDRRQGERPLGASPDNAGWRCKTFTLERATSADTDILDLTADVAARVAESEIREGNVVVFTPGSTAAVSTIEFESGAVADLAAAIERIAPRDMRYAHNERWGDGNGYSHVRSALLGPAITVPLAAGELMLGTWQQIVLIDFDNRPRRRKVVVQVNGR